MFWVSFVHRLVLDSLGSVLPQILFGTMSYGRETSVAVPPDVFVCFSSHSSVSKVRRFSGNVTAAAIVVLETIVLGRQTNALSLFILTIVLDVTFSKKLVVVKTRCGKGLRVNVREKFWTHRK